jgi:hypothetical protein
MPTAYSSKKPSQSDTRYDKTEMTAMKSNGKPETRTAISFEQQQGIHELYSPQPISMPLIGALILLQSPLYSEEEVNKVFLLPKNYLQNWIIWAYHQPVISSGETRRLQLALRMAAERLFLKLPKLNDPHRDPGPIDATSLSEKENPLVMRENVYIWDGVRKESMENIMACAVPERFYEVRLDGLDSSVIFLIFEYDSQ